MARKSKEEIEKLEDVSDVPTLESTLEDVSDMPQKIKKELPEVIVQGEEIEVPEVSNKAQLIDENIVILSPEKKKGKRINIPKDYTGELDKKFQIK